jgi:hypothetical protein
VPRARAEQQFQRKVARRALGPLLALLAARVSLVVFEMWTEIYRAQPPKPVRTPPALPSKETSRAIASAYPPSWLYRRCDLAIGLVGNVTIFVAWP